MCKQGCINTLVAFVFLVWFLDCRVGWGTWLDFSPLGVFKCVIKSSDREVALSHRLHLLDCVFSNESSNRLHELKQSHTGCICLIFPHYVFSNVLSNWLLERLHSHIGCICCTFSTVCSQMCPQIVCLKGCIITCCIGWLFSTVNFQMCSQMPCLSRSKVTLVAFVGIFCTVSFQMCPQIACISLGKVTLFAFVWLFLTVFSNVFSNCLLETLHSLIGCFCWTFLHCVFSNVFSKRLHTRM